MGKSNGTFSNGQTLVLGQVALATFPNSQGLLRTGGNDFMASLASGLPAIGIAGTGGRGQIAGGALENSNVDIASEFANLILAQRGYQANARAITTADQVMQEALQMKQ
jgi:flagellar hook protein FlgE